MIETIQRHIILFMSLGTAELLTVAENIIRSQTGRRNTSYLAKLERFGKRSVRVTIVPGDESTRNGGHRPTEYIITALKRKN